MSKAPEFNGNPAAHIRLIYDTALELRFTVDRQGLLQFIAALDANASSIILPMGSTTEGMGARFHRLDASSAVQLYSARSIEMRGENAQDKELIEAALKRRGMSVRTI